MPAPTSTGRVRPGVGGPPRSTSAARFAAEDAWVPQDEPLVSDDEDVQEPEAKRARTCALLCNSLVDASVNELDAGKYAMAMMGSADEATFIELYGRGPIINEANGPRRNLGLRGLSAFYLRTMKPDGGNLDFRLKSDRHLALKMLEDRNPDFVIGSPPCTAWCVCVCGSNISTSSASAPKRVKEMTDEGNVHLNFVARLYCRRIANGKFPSRATRVGVVVE